MLVSSELSVTVGTTSGPFVGSAANRVCLIISSPKTNAITISQKNPAVLGGGLTIRPDTDTTILCADDVGPWIQGDLQCIADTASETIGVIEVLDL